MAFFNKVLRYMGVAAENPPNVIRVPRAPTTADRAFQLGTLWIDSATDISYQLTNVIAGVATWTILGPGTSDVDTLTGDSGGAIAPVAGNIDLLGTADQIETVGTPGTITFSIPDPFIAPGSIESTTTITSGTGISSTTGDIVADAGDISATLGSVSAATSVTAGTTVTATLGAITATNGNVVLSTAGNKLVIATGANASVGTSAAMVAGEIAVATTASSATAKIFYARATVGGTAGDVSITAQDGTGFTLTSSSNTETSTFNWWIINA